MKIRLVGVSRGRTGWADEAAKDYGRRIARYASFEETQLKPHKGGAAQECQKVESERLMKLVGSRDRLIALDERGVGLSSEEWAELLDGAARSSVGGLVFAIGGPYGHGEVVRQAAHKCVALAPMVLNHQVARVVVLEQIYRAWTILRREPYHHA